MLAQSVGDWAEELRVRVPVRINKKRNWNYHFWEFCIFTTPRQTGCFKTIAIEYSSLIKDLKRFTSALQLLQLSACVCVCSCVLNRAFLWRMGAWVHVVTGASEKVCTSVWLLALGDRSYQDNIVLLTEIGFLSESLALEYELKAKLERAEGADSDTPFPCFSSA